MLSRRHFVGRLGAAVVLAQAGGVFASVIDPAAAAAQNSPAEALNGLLAFVVPGTDTYSLQQGVTDPTAGGVDAGVLPALIETLDASPSPIPPAPTSAVVAGLLDQVAAGVNTEAAGFAGLSFGEKMGVFAYLEGDPNTAPLAQALLTLAAFLAYSEAGVFEGTTRTLTGEPLGWELSGYPGVSDGRDEFVGYYRGVREARP